MRRRVLGVFFVFVLGGCAGIRHASPVPTAAPESAVSSTPATSTSKAGGTPDPNQALTTACFGTAPPTFSEYTSWTKVNPRPIPGHEVYVNIYVNGLAKKTYLSASGKPFPTCATIVKAHLTGAESTDVTALTVMVKMPAGYDPENNDWWWAMYDPAGKSVESSGRLSQCISCHQPAAAADYVFSQKVMAESKP